MEYSVFCKVFFLAAFIASLSLLSGCALGPRKFLEQPHPHHTHPVRFREYQARFSDMPFPFDGEIVNEERSEESDQNPMLQDFFGQNNFDDIKSQSFVITCLTDLPLPDLCHLYRAEMEQLGWRERALFHDVFSKEKQKADSGFTFVFEKPDNKLCIITAQCRTKVVHKKTHKKYITRYYRA